MNIWALDKDESIKLLLLLLREQLGPTSFVVLENEELHPRAIRLAKRDDPSVSAYLYTYGQPSGTCGIHLELPDHADESVSSDMEIHEAVQVERLAAMLSVHFDIAPVTLS